MAKENISLSWQFHFLSDRTNQTFWCWVYTLTLYATGKGLIAENGEMGNRSKSNVLVSWFLSTCYKAQYCWLKNSALKKTTLKMSSGIIAFKSFNPWKLMQVIYKQSVGDEYICLHHSSFWLAFYLLYFSVATSLFRCKNINLPSHLDKLRYDLGGIYEIVFPLLPWYIWYILWIVISIWKLPLIAW